MIWAKTMQRYVYPITNNNEQNNIQIFSKKLIKFPSGLTLQTQRKRERNKQYYLMNEGF